MEAGKGIHQHVGGVPVADWLGVVVIAALANKYLKVPMGRAVAYTLLFAVSLHSLAGVHTTIGTTGEMIIAGSSLVYLLNTQS